MWQLRKRLLRSALQIVDGKAKLVKEDFCDGFGDCIAECPTGALVIEEKESRQFDLEAVKEAGKKFPIKKTKIGIQGQII